MTICKPYNFKPTHFTEKTIEYFEADFNLDHYSIDIYNDSNIDSGMTNFAQTGDADIIEISTYWRTEINQFLNGRIS